MPMTAAATYGVPEARPIPEPLIPIGAASRDEMVLIAAAMVSGRRDYHIAAYREDGWPDELVAWLDEPGVRDEMDRLVDLLLVAQQSPSSVRGGAR